MSDSDGLFPATELEHVDPVVDDSVEAGAGVTKRSRAFEPAAVMLVPPSLDERLPQNHLSRSIAVHRGHRRNPAGPVEVSRLVREVEGAAALRPQIRRPTD